MKKHLRNDIEKLMDSYIASGKLMGASVLVKRGGEEELYYHTGLADRESGKPFARDTIVRMFSMTKPITALLAMILMSRGKFSLIDPISFYLPAFASQKVMLPSGALEAPLRSIYVRDLLNMTSGLVYPSEASNAERLVMGLYSEQDRRTKAGNPFTTREMADGLAALPLMFQPGTRWMYGTSADVLGALLEEVAGMPLSELMRKEIFEPLGMEDTAFYVPEEKQERFAAVYNSEKGSGLERDERLFLGMNDFRHKPAFESGGAGLLSTADDYMRFATAMLSKGKYGGGRLLPEKYFDIFTKNMLPPHLLSSYETAWDSAFGWGYGALMRVLREQSSAITLGSVGEYGWDGLAGTYFTVAPKDDLILEILMQRSDMWTVNLVPCLRNLIFSEV